MISMDTSIKRNERDIVVTLLKHEYYKTKIEI